MSSTLPPPPAPPPSEEPRRPRFQFSMATLMGTVTLVAVGLGLLVAMPLWIGVLVLSFTQVALIAFLIAGALFADGTKRTFCIGAVAVFLLNLFQAPLYLIMGSTFQYSSILQGGLHIGIEMATALFGGWICVVARRFWERRNP